MQIQKVQIISDLLCYGPRPEPNDEVEQRLTISSSGRIWFTRYSYGTGYGKYEVGRKKQLFIGKARAAKLLELISSYIENNDICIVATDIGDWNMTAVDVVGKKYSKTGSMCGGVIARDIDLTDYIRMAILIEELTVFGGGYNMV
ncbi:hypothetical protein [uncultured Phascolarctobacterium sp.]|uniref:hypothetical protein n=1 Tax=uncultured Phascolarctobacterium sp. TaxID=512296 RepID=UPI0027D9B3FF|nr:hypothetical protein [uncultured Phascolarctobacterium sp.]